MRREMSRRGRGGGRGGLGPLWGEGMYPDQVEIQVSGEDLGATTGKGSWDCKGVQACPSDSCEGSHGQGCVASPWGLSTDRADGAGGTGAELGGELPHLP